jgi:hypothetical protein
MCLLFKTRACCRDGHDTGIPSSGAEEIRRICEREEGACSAHDPSPGTPPEEVEVIFGRCCGTQETELRHTSLFFTLRGHRSVTTHVEIHGVPSNTTKVKSWQVLNAMETSFNRTDWLAHSFRRDVKHYGVLSYTHGNVDFRHREDEA